MNGRSILTLDKPGKFDKLSPVSIFTIAKEYKLPHLFLADRKFSGFFSAYQNSKDIQLSYGIKMLVVKKADDISENSLKTGSIVTIWAKNSHGQKDLIKCYNLSWSKDFFYYENRLDWKLLNENVTDNLLVTVDYYNGFIARNFLEGYDCLPSFNTFNPIFEISEMGLPFDSVITKKIQLFNTDNKYDYLHTHPIFYYAKEDFRAFLTMKAINNRSKVDDIGIDHLSVDTFCWEEYCNRSGINFIKYA